MLCSCSKTIVHSAASCSLVITADQAVRGGKVIPLKETVDEAIQGLDSVKRVYVASRTGENVNMEKDRDIHLQEVSDCS